VPTPTMFGRRLFTCSQTEGTSKCQDRMTERTITLLRQPWRSNYSHRANTARLLSAKLRCLQLNVQTIFTTVAIRKGKGKGLELVIAPLT